MKRFDLIMAGAVFAALVLSPTALGAAEESFPRPPTDPLNLRFLAEAGAGEYYFIELSTLSGNREALSVWLLDLYNPP
jgi:hypothetical protein